MQEKSASEIAKNASEIEQNTAIQGENAVTLEENAVPPPIADTGPSRVEEGVLSASTAPPVNTTPPLEAAASLVEADSPLVRKTFEIDAASLVVVKGEAAGLPVVYDMAAAITAGDGVIAVPYEIRDSKASKRGRVLWKARSDDGEQFPAGLLLGFDDNFVSSWEAAFPVFDEAGCKVTFFVQGGYTPFWDKAQERGHEIAWHTVNHKDLRALDNVSFLRETTAPLAVFRARGFAMRAFAYPFGYSTPEREETLLRSFRVLRGFGVLPHIYTVNQIRAGRVSSKSLDNTVNPDETLFRASLTLLLRVTKFLGPGHVLPVTTHEISAEAAWGIKPERLKFLLAAAKDLHLKFYRYSDFFSD